MKDTKKPSKELSMQYDLMQLEDSRYRSPRVNEPFDPKVSFAHSDSLDPSDHEER